MLYTHAQHIDLQINLIRASMPIQHPIVQRNFLTLFWAFSNGKLAENADLEELPDTPFQRQLAMMEACIEARTWVGSRDLDHAWLICNRSDWMLWLAETLELNTYKTRAAYDHFGSVPADFIREHVTLDDLRYALEARYEGPE